MWARKKYSTRCNVKLDYMVTPFKTAPCPLGMRGGSHHPTPSPLCPGLPALSESPPNHGISRNPSLKTKLLNFPAGVYMGEERPEVELSPVLQSPHKKREAGSTPP